MKKYEVQCSKIVFHIESYSIEAKNKEEAIKGIKNKINEDEVGNEYLNADWIEHIDRQDFEAEELK